MRCNRLDEFVVFTQAKVLKLKLKTTFGNRNNQSETQPDRSPVMGEFPPLRQGGRDAGIRYRRAAHSGRSFPEWGDTDGNFGEIHVLRVEGLNGPLPRKPFLIRKSIETLLKAKVTDASPERQGETYVLRMRNKQQVAKLKSLTQLADGTGIRIIDHPTLNSVKCVITC